MSENVNSTAWKVGWRPKAVIIGLLIVGGVIGALIDQAGSFAFLGLIAGVGVWFWGRSEINDKHVSVLGDFRDRSYSKVEDATAGLEAEAVHSFISSNGNSPPLIEPDSEYYASHLLFGDTSVLVNDEYQFDMVSRKMVQGGSQNEYFYDQITGVDSENYNNYGELVINMSGGGSHVIRSRDSSSINDVKSDLQQRMRNARRVEN